MKGIYVNINNVEYTEELNKSFGFPAFDDTFNTLSFNDATRYFIITPVLDDFYYYQDGIKYIHEADSVQLPDEEGLYAIYYDTMLNHNIIYSKKPKV